MTIQEIKEKLKQMKEEEKAKYEEIKMDINTSYPKIKEIKYKGGI